VTRSNTCTEDGIKHFKCTNCTAEKDEILEATGHNYVDTVHAATCTERGYTEHICQNCGISYNSDFTALAEHEYEETIVNPATCTTDGVKKLVCGHCGHTQSVTIAATGHQFTDEVIEATQDTLGYTIHTCDKCDYSYIDTFTEYTSEEPIERIPGDVNDDGTVDLVDVILIRRFLAGGWNVTINEDNADVDGDNEVTLADVILIRRYLAGGFDVILK
jgi:predicted nucleic-acid-binding Zn-ribbon protein